MQHIRQHPKRLALGTAAALLLGLVWSAELHAAPARPTDDGQILERLPATTQHGDGSLGALRAALRGDPLDLSLALRTARAYAALGRAEADPRFYGYAQSALGPWWRLDDPPVEVLVLRAVLHQAGHDFDAALADLSRALAKTPNHAQARLTQALVLRAQGRPGDAADSCRALGPRVMPLAAATCLGATESLNGGAAGSYRALHQTLADATEAPDELKLWALTVLGEIAAETGDDAAAEGHFRAALALGRRNTYLLGALADLLLDRGRFAEARALLAGEGRSDALLLRLTEAELRLGDDKAQAHRAELAARFAAGRRRGDSRHGREAARFHLRILGRAEEGLRLAEENWRAQREPADAALLLEAALAAGAPVAAKPVLDWLRATGLESRRLSDLAVLLEKEQAT